MATTVVSGKSCEGASMEKFGGGGTALLPRTKQLLTVLWERICVLVHVIYYTLVSVCQMFRFEVHVRITDETGEHIQHISTATNPAESFLFTSLFDGDTGVMVGGSNPLSNFCADVGEPFVGKTTAEALLSSLRADDLCCGLVDDFVSRTSSKDDGIFLGHQSSWNMGFPHDWNVFVSNSNCSSSNDTCHRSSMKDLPKDRVYKQDSSEEERSSHWSSEEDPNLVEFDSEESKALWESMSKSSDPYNPFFFSGCISTNTNMGNSRREASDTDLMSVSKASEELLGLRALNIWVSRSDSESSSSSWASSDGSSPDIEEESERLLEFFRCPDDPYNPMCFTASTSTVSKQASLTPPEERESFFTSSSEDDEEDQLWKSLCQNDDPYHPLNFQACLHSSQTTKPKPGVCPDVSPMKDKTREKEATTLQKPRTPKTPKTPRPERRQKHHSDSDKTLVHLKRPGQTSRPSLEDKKESRSSTAQYKVRFSPVVQVHVMHTWLFARQAARKGPWEEMARDRARFKRRIEETEQAIGYCLSHAHRERIRANLQGAST